MLRRLFTLLSALSLLLFAATAVLWVRSYSVADAFNWGRWGPAWGYSGKTIVSENGRLLWNDMRLPRSRKPPDDDLGLSWQRRELQNHLSPAAGEPAWERAGFYWSWLDDGIGNVHGRAGSAPHWAAVSFLGLLPALWVVRRHRARRRHPGLCPACGYDLRATPGRCPECGTAASNEE